MTANDHQFLAHALRIAAQGLGRTWPNPTVGCVLVNNNHIIGLGRTADGGRPHAETEALAMAGSAARGATAYVTLEPCSHHGQTPPCAQALIDAGVARVVVACIDADPRVSGNGIAMLREAGITVDLIELPEAAKLNAGFFSRVQNGMPHVAMKLAVSRDDFMARGDGGGQWLTGPRAREHGHLMRAQFDCIVTGIGTVLSDDPHLTVRAPVAPHAGLVRVVCDRNVRLPLTSNLVKTARRQPVWVITHGEAVELAASHANDLREAGVKFLVMNEVALPPNTILRALAAEGITRAFIEAGPKLSSDFLAATLVNTLHCYRAPMLLGNAGKSPIDALHSLLADAMRAEMRMLDQDVYERFEL